MSKIFFLFSLKLFLVLSLTFIVHAGLLNYLKLSFFDFYVLRSYWVNYLMAVLIFILLLVLKKKFFHLLGFVFMAGSFLKFGVFFVFFYPIFKQDLIITPFETTSFLVPYFTCLIVEVYYLSKLLNQNQ